MVGRPAERWFTGRQTRPGDNQGPSCRRSVLSGSLCLSLSGGNSGGTSSGLPADVSKSRPAQPPRRLPSWLNKSEAEIAAKHQQDVSKITGLSILDRQQLSDDKVRLKVQIEGTGREAFVDLNLVGKDWKFGGFAAQPK